MDPIDQKKASNHFGVFFIYNYRFFVVLTRKNP